jgi:hypothetical protein
MTKKGLIAESADFEGDELNEGMLSNLKTWFQKTKSKISEYLIKIGAGGALGGIITMGIGAGQLPDMTYQPSNVYSDPNQLLTAGAIAAVVGLAALLTGLGTSKDASKAIEKGMDKGKGY